TFLPKGINGNGQVFAYVQPIGSRTNLTAWLVWPPLMAFRALEPKLAVYSLSKLKPSDVRSPLAGVTGRRFDLPSHGPHKEALWIDESGLIRRAQAERDGRLTSRADVRYERRHGIDFPVWWTSIDYSQDGAVRRERTAEVVEVTVNHDVADAVFDV